MSQTTIQLADSISQKAYEDSLRAFRDAGNLFRSHDLRWKTAREILYKKADFGSNSNPQFERAFGSIGFTYLQDKAPGIMDYIVGFQLLDRDETGDRSFGAFVAKIGERIIDIPMFFINGELKGHQVMRLRAPDLFVPLREAFLDYLFSKTPQDMGDPGLSPGEQSEVRASPDIRPFSGERYLKNTIAHLKDWAKTYKVAEAFADMVLSTRTLVPAIAMKRKEAGSHIDLRAFLQQQPQHLKVAAKLCDLYPELHRRMNRLMGDDWCLSLAKEAAEKASEVKPRISPESFTARSVPSLNQREKAAGVSRYDFSAAAVNLSQEQREELVRYGDIIVDRRPAEKLAKLYEVEEAVSFSPVQYAGVYPVMLADESYKDLAIFPANSYISGAPCELLVDPKTKNTVIADGGGYLAKVESNESVDTNVLSSNPLKTTRKRPKEKEIVLVLSSEGKIAGPYLIEEKLSENRYKVEDVCYSFKGDTSPLLGEEEGYRVSSSYPCSCDQLIFLGGSVRSGLQINDRVLTAGDSAGVFVIGSVNKDDEDYRSCDSVRKLSKSKKLELFSPRRLRPHKLGKQANLRVQVRGKHTAALNGREYSLKEARYRLLGAGLSKTAAEDILASKPGAVRSLLVIDPSRSVSSLTDIPKLAATTPRLDVPEFEDDYTSESGRYQMSEPQQLIAESEDPDTRQPLLPWEDADMVDELNAPSLGGDMQRLMDQDGPGIMDDLVGLVSIIRNSRIDTTVRETTKSLLQTTDKLGRQLIEFYAKNEEYADQYGEAELQDLESNIITAFETSGDLFIALARKSANPNPELDLTSVAG